MKPDYLGARGSNTGDDFHEWWALRSALTLINPDTDLTAISVEGVSQDNKKEGLNNWDSVDCGLYYDGITIEDAKKIVIEQIKYSASTSEALWTVSELTKSKSKTSNNSIIKGLADSFINIQGIRPDLIKNNLFTICLVSNRSFGNDLKKAFGNINPIKYERLRYVSSLSKIDFEKFIEVFDFSNCGTGSRFKQEELAINEILEHTHNIDRGFVLDLKDRIHKLMLPEETGKYITKETILTWMYVSDPLALFPCPARLKTVDNSVNRYVTTVIHNAILDGNQYICLHGEGGSGKTTILSQVEKMLTETSTMIIYDCYGAGTYMESDAYRHRPKNVVCTNPMSFPMR